MIVIAAFALSLCALLVSLMTWQRTSVLGAKLRSCEDRLMPDRSTPGKRVHGWPYTNPRKQI